MRFECKNLGFHFEMNNENYIAINDEAKKQLFGMNDQQLKETLYVFMEVKDNKFTGKYFQMVLDGGFYPTPEDVEKGQNLAIENIKKFAPDMKLVDESEIMPQNIRTCVWQMSNGSLLSQYYMVKNGYMVCVAGVILQPHDTLDTLMASVCMSATSETQQDIAREQQQSVLSQITAEANKLIANGMPKDKAIEMAFEKFGLKRN